MHAHIAPVVRLEALSTYKGLGTRLLELIQLTASYGLLLDIGEKHIFTQLPQ